MQKTIIALATVFALGSTAAMAQQQQSQDPMAQQQQTQEITEGMLVKFVTAMEDVQGVTEKYRDQFQEAENQEEAREIQQSAQEEMIAAVEDAGLTPQEYNMIIQQAQNDEELRARLEEMTGEENS
ncbi:MULTISPECIES: DUF4168 domain-containing protein [Idiomarina]|jgi:flagellar basal body P-ring protein FlgI|uniref:DUF4168 domain-containing protein n=1 Tax=Idiomarina abyssalis TaxID=86102 RepID=A0A8I1KER8_9GAMM|nr:MULTISPECIES: DUF4168 domain-containing protein [Idiomarina]KPD22006.1 hypothetical protein ADS78_06030 [Idiomarina abyssalis]MBE92520.1 DUF4168 domain-containing protein [Idiomarina sp.]MBJ7266077.1 DUF4168 domain-containing protein [Idiomarina abyssalis]MBJ7272866.1 DUF4168 domain-containing protein [Idiomarina abyssalis]MBJ7316216.1 DUF4168 domain-containing protein [Idiomarina abyssalis]|tara:strand:- start:626 stop:1003 length:378 start_codon:yes stop_codon:yes gene_type:complete